MLGPQGPNEGTLHSMSLVSGLDPSSVFQKGKKKSTFRKLTLIASSGKTPIVLGPKEGANSIPCAP